MHPFMIRKPVLRKLQMRDGFPSDDTASIMHCGKKKKKKKPKVCLELEPVRDSLGVSSGGLTSEVKVNTVIATPPPLPPPP